MKLAELMNKRGLTDSELAKIMDCQPSTIFQWKAGGYSPKAENMLKLCQTLNCSADELLGFNSVAVELPNYQGQRLYRAVTQEGAFDSQLIHLFATRLRQFTGKTTSLEIWMRNIAEALYEIELAESDPASLSHPGMKLVDAPVLPLPVKHEELKQPPRKIAHKRRKKLMGFSRHQSIT